VVSTADSTCKKSPVLSVARSIDNMDVSDVADTFYGHLFQPGADPSSPYPDITQAADSLYRAVAKLRDENAPFIRWVPFVHFGM
jgi:hypothetical protein